MSAEMNLLLLYIFTLFQFIIALNDWDKFKLTYEKVYGSSAEENYHKEIFMENVKLLEEQNEKYENGLSTFSVKVNKFTDLPRRKVGFATNAQSMVQKQFSKTNTKAIIPESIDWRDFGVITPVPDQLFCESCWAFAVAGTVEAHMGIYHEKNVSLSQQNLMDCVDTTFNCNQNLQRQMLAKTYQYITDNNGIDTAESYPYEYYAVGDCRFTRETVGATIAGYANITEGDEEELKAIVGTVGPVTVTITTDYLWESYRDGVFYSENCMDTALIFNHAVIVVGYGNENGQDYWLVKNSWGTWFGQEGYIKMARNKDNNCGIASYARYPLM